MNKLIMVVLALLGAVACSDVKKEATVAPAPVAQTDVTWDAVGEVFFNEFIPCTAGPDFNQESLDEMVAEWRSGGLAPELLGAWGYAPASDQNQFPNGWWELSWSSKADADAVWGQLAENDAAKAWSAKYESVLVCDGPGRYGWDFSFSRAPDSFGASPASGEFASAYFACTFNEGKGFDDLSASIAAYDSWLDTLDAESAGFYAYGIYSARPETDTEGVDFFFGNFHESFDSMKLGNEGWEKTGGAAKASMEATATCANPDVYNSKTFYDPTNPDFS